MFKLKYVTFLLIILSLACNVSLLQAKLVDKSSKKMPSWIGQNSEDKKKLYFSGASTQETFDKARQFAINDALTQVIQSLDLTMSVNTNRIISDTGIYLDEKTKSKTRDVKLLDTKLKDIYFEKYENSGKISYTVHALIEYKKKDYEEEKARLQKEYEELKQNLANRYTKAKQLLNDNLLYQALPELIESLKIIYTYGINQTLESEIVAHINDVLGYISFKNSFGLTQNHSGIKSDILVYYSKTNEICQKYSFIVKTANNFSIETIYSNNEGKLDYSFNKVSYLKKSNYKLEFDLQTTFNLDEDFYKNYLFRTVSDELNFLGDKKKIVLNVVANKNKDDLIKVITADLVQNGFVVVKKDGADYILDVDFDFIDSTTTDLRSMQSLDTTLFISNANVVAELLLYNTQTQINSFSSQEKGFGKTKAKSYYDLIQKVSASIINSL